MEYSYSNRFRMIYFITTVLECTPQVHISDIGSYRIQPSDRISSDFRVTDLNRIPAVGIVSDSDS